MKSLLRAGAAIAIVVLTSDARADEPPAPPPPGVVLVSEVLFGRSVTAIGDGRELALRGLPEIRQPQWTGPDPPKPPPFHVRFFRITF
jgi:hypothetical protein